ncbi:unnamed protein product [Echinostoma caproni]|uniref:TPH domain-containing protein n=1 Tax=Echinostoma caproni TaxID=27848 RepID=A0A183ADE9_9TREM|nr:unnamed protein product [Echinostoma caproni]
MRQEVQEEAALKRQRKEEELIRLEMIRVRKELEAEKNRASRERCRQWLTNENEVAQYAESTIPSTRISNRNINASPDFDRSSSNSRSSDDDKSCSHPSSRNPVPDTNENVLPRLQFSTETRTFLHKCLTAWNRLVQQSYVRSKAATVRYELRLQRSVLRAWKSMVIRVRLSKEIELAEIEAKQLERLEAQASDFREQHLKRICFFKWQESIKLHKMRQEHTERDQHRRAREREFLEQLRSRPPKEDLMLLKKVEDNTNTQLVLRKECTVQIKLLISCIRKANLAMGLCDERMDESRMEQQAVERARLKAEREERRRLAEAKRKEEEARQLEEEAKRIKEERHAILEAQRAKKREEEEACELTRQTEERAYAWYEQQLMRRILSYWSNHVTEIRLWEWQLEDVAETHWLCSLKQRCITAWRHYPQLMHEERERERRLERLRSKLRDVVPDFSPPKSENSPL